MSYTGLGGTEDISKDLLDLGLKKADEVLGTHVPMKAKKAYALAFAMARTQAKKALSHPTAQNAFNVANTVIDAGTTGFRFASNIAAGKYKADASGVIAFSSDLQKSLVSLVKFGRSIGMSQGVATQLIDAVSIGTGCAAGVAAGVAAGPTGAVAGGVACVFQVVSKLFELFWQGTKVLPPGDPRAVFFVNEERTAQAVIDAMRLSKVLKTYYGITSYGQLKSRMMDIPSSAPQCYLFSECLDRGGRGYPARGSSRKTPAVDLHWILLAMQTGSNRWANIKDALSVIERGRAKTEYDQGVPINPTIWKPNSGRRLWHRYYEDNDINVPAIELGAFFARSSIAARGTPIAPVRIIGMDRDALKPYDWQPDFSPFMRVDELLNFFVAVTLQELADGLNPVAPYDAAFSVTWRTVCDDTRVGGPACKDGFSENYWTNLSPHRWRDQIVAGVKQRDPQALKDFAVVRLVSAWSYMHMLYNWTSASGQQDIVALTDAVSAADPFFEFKVPVDPRQAFIGTDGRWHNRAGEQPGVLSTWVAPSINFGFTRSYAAMLPGIRPTQTRVHGFKLAGDIARLSNEVGNAFKRGQEDGTQQAVYELWQQFKEPTSTGLTSIAQQSNLWQQAITSGKIAMFIRPDLMPAGMAPPAFVPGASVPAGMQPPTPPVQPPAAGVGILPIAAAAGLALLFLRR